MLGRNRRQPVQRRDETEWRMRSRKAMPFHEILREEEISDGGQNRDEENANRRFPLIEQPLHEHQRALEIASRHGVPQFEDDARAGERNELADNFYGHASLATLMQIDLLQLILDLARVAAGEQDEEITS